LNLRFAKPKKRGLEQAVDLPHETLQEEKKTDTDLTKIAA
jgi:ferritin-like metal-binding protein YciE